MSYLTPGCLCFDIGANVGQTAAEFVAAGAGQVVGVEPCIENYLLLARRPKTIPILAAAWKEITLLNVSFASNQCGWSSVDPEKWSKAYPTAHWANPQPVVAITLDMLRKVYGEPYLIKIDVEGVEKEVIKGLTAKCPYLMFEFHGKFADDTLECLNLCKALGFTRAHYVRENMDLDTIPTTLIDEFIPRWQADAPEWGNITVC